MEGHCSAGQSPQWVVVPMEEERRYPSSENRQPISVGYLVVLEWDELLLAEV